MEKDLNYCLSLDYPFIVSTIVEDGEKAIVARFNDLPNCIGAGETIEESIQNAMDAKQALFTVMLEQGNKIPEPAEYSESIDLITLPEIHQWLAETAAQEGLTINQFINQIIAEAKKLKTSNS